MKRFEQEGYPGAIFIVSPSPQRGRDTSSDQAHLPQPPIETFNEAIVCVLASAGFVGLTSVSVAIGISEISLRSGLFI